MKKQTSSKKPDPQLPVSKRLPGVLLERSSEVRLPGVGAVVGAVAGTIMGNRAAEGKPLVSPTTVRATKNAVIAVQKKLPSKKTSRPRIKSPKSQAKVKAPKKSPKKPVSSKAVSKRTSTKKAAKKAR